MSYLTCTDCTTTFADSETEVHVQCDFREQLNVDFYVITRHAHFNAFRKGDGTGNVRCTEVELRTIVVAKRSVTTTFFFLQNVNRSFEVFVRMNGTRFCDNHTTTDFIFVDTTEQQTYVITSLTSVEDLAEHFNTRNDGFEFLSTHTDDVNRVRSVDNTRFDTTCSNGTTTCDGEYVFNWHEEIFINIARRKRNPSVNCVHEFHDLFNPLRFEVQTTESRTADNRSVVAVETVERQEVTDFHFNEVEQFRVVNQVNFVHENNHSRYTYLFCQQDVLASLRHRTIRCSNNEDSAVHLSSTRYHVLHIVGVTRTVNVCVVTSCSLIFNVSGVDGNTTLFFFRSIVDRIERSHFRETLVSQHCSDSSGQSSFAVVNVADSTHVHVGFSAFKFLFCHFFL